MNEAVWQLVVGGVDEPGGGVGRLGETQRAGVRRRRGSRESRDRRGTLRWINREEIGGSGRVVFLLGPGRAKAAGCVELLRQRICRLRIDALIAIGGLAYRVIDRANIDRPRRRVRPPAGESDTFTERIRAIERDRKRVV